MEASSRVRALLEGCPSAAGGGAAAGSRTPTVLSCPKPNPVLAMTNPPERDKCPVPEASFLCDGPIEESSAIFAQVNSWTLQVRVTSPSMALT